jgi:LacI family transcriptional regulator
MKRRSTLQDVAELAKVSPATVSRVMNRTGRVSPKLDSRIRSAAEKLGFPLNKKKGTRLIAFLLGNRSLTHPFHSQVLLSAEEYCASHGYNLLFFPLRYAPHVPPDKLDVPQILLRSDVIDGYLVAGVNYWNLLEFLRKTELPFSVLGDSVQGEWDPKAYDVVWVDETSGAYEVTRTMLSLGHTRIAYVANTRMIWFARRLNGYRRAMEEAGLTPLVASLDSENEHEVGYLGTKQILTRARGDVTAIFAGSDVVAPGVYAALREASLRVPEDISVCGFNDMPVATVLHPALTSVRVFPELLGRFLAETMFARMANATLTPQERMIPTQVIKRESCAAPEAVVGALPYVPKVGAG